MTESAQPVAGKSTNKALSVAAILCLIAGIGLGALALAGPLAVWLGLGDFRVGFKLLQMANAWAGWVAAVTAVAAVGIFLLARMKDQQAGAKLSALALLGAISAALVWYVPQTFRPPEGTPAIHDVATDPYNPLEFVAIAPLRTDAPNNMEYGVMPGMDSVQQHIDVQVQAYPDIVPQVYEQPVDEVFARALAAADAMGWEVVASDADSGRIEATDTTFWFRFKDDVVVQVSENAAGETVLQARSLSRVGRGDVGKNAARLREFFALVRDG